MKQEIVQRKAVEESLRKSEQTSSQLLEKSRQMQEQLRHLSRQLLSAQEEERKKISRELHDVIAQTLTGINVRLATLKTEATVNTKELQKKIASTQRLVEKSVDIVHRFARELRPTVLDDLGLIPALHSFMKSFTEDTGVRVSLTAFAGVEAIGQRQAHGALSRRPGSAHQCRPPCAGQPGGSEHPEARTASSAWRSRTTAKAFDVDGALRAKKSNRLGLLGMRERVEMVGGTFLRRIRTGQGTPPSGRRFRSAKPQRGRTAAAENPGKATTLECP